ncbi:MAG: hypothetical protein JW751_23870, partial [Polyangiaceae bacterium]|nr:hypothetical protein [Polyangiaceae bacterium]
MTIRRPLRTTLATATIAGIAALLALPAAAQRRPRAGKYPALFAPSGQCVACHNGITTASGRDVSIGADWRASMMANAARDPYWQAAVRRESLDHPTATAAIEDECSKCHMPMARFTAHVAGGQGEIFAHLPIGRAAAPLAALAADGVSCTVCHQISAEKLGTTESFVGGFVIDRRLPLGRRPVFGKYPVDVGRSRVMRSSSGFEQRQAEHLKTSEVCATCHTLITHSLGPDGSVSGRLAEQVPYLEWRHSDHATRSSCQDCHLLPEVDPTAITSVLAQPHPGMRSHVFRGGNAFVLGMLARYRGELGVTAFPTELEATAAGTREQLERRSATLTIVRAERSAATLVVDLRLENQAGHKLPTAYPSRRIWIHLAIRDASGRVWFESGALARDGSITGNDNDDDSGRFEPHYRVIERPDQVQIYEPILGDPSGAVTTGLLTATRYLKDNRVLPTGFDPRTAPADVAVYGEAATDPDFVGGADELRYRIALADAAGPLELTAELLYQPIGYRWAENLRRVAAPEPARFGRYYSAMAPASATTLATCRRTIQP